MAPVFKTIAQDMHGEAQFGEVDLDQSPEVAARYGVQSIPTVLLFKEGHVIGRIVGLRPQPDVVRFITTHLE